MIKMAGALQTPETWMGARLPGQGRQVQPEHPTHGGDHLLRGLCGRPAEPGGTEPETLPGTHGGDQVYGCSSQQDDCCHWWVNSIPCMSLLQKRILWSFIYIIKKMFPKKEIVMVEVWRHFLPVKKLITHISGQGHGYYKREGDPHIQVNRVFFVCLMSFGL